MIFNFFLTLCKSASKRNDIFRRHLITRCLPATDKKMSGEGRRTIKIYTRTGDDGTSGLFTGERRQKDDEAFEALGTTDELNSAIGLAREFCKENNPGLVQRLEEVQCALQDVNSNIATPKSSARERHTSKTEFSSQLVPELEKWIDEYTAQLPPLKMFIIPSGGKAASSLHMARSVCRRAERRVIPLVRAGEMDEEPLKYLNRLSDFLFTVARFAAQTEGQKEVIYRRKDSKTKS